MSPCAGGRTIASSTLVLLLALHLILTALPGVAVVLFAVRRGIGNVAVLLALGLAACGFLGLLGFWLFYLSPTVGKAFSFALPAAAILLGAWSVWRGELDRELLRRLAVPLGLWALGCLFLTFFGFLHGGAAEPLATAGSRFGGPLPSDSDIPLFFAEWFYLHGHHGTPPIFPGEWLASDRPPLQSGYVMTQRPFHWSTIGIDYQLVGTALQQLWIIGLWALLEAAGIGRRTKGLVMIAVLVSGLALLNGFYVWPKMLPAAFLLAAAALILTPLWSQARHRYWGATLFAALCGLAMMGHGGSVFAIIALVAVAAFRRPPNWRWIGIAVGVGVIVIGPWSAYQKWGDPPGNRLLKWTLASDTEVNDRTTSESIRSAYAAAGIDGTVSNKRENFETIFGSGTAWEYVENATEGSLTFAVTNLRAVIFFYLFPSLTLLLLAPFAMLFFHSRRDRAGPEWSFALRCFAAVLVGAVAWGLLVFGGPADLTVNHIGSYALPILAMAGAVAGLRSLLPRFALWWTLLFAAFNLALYTPALLPPPGSSYSALAAILSALGLIAFGLLAIGGARIPTLPKSLAREIPQTS